MVSVLASNALNRGFEPMLCIIKDYGCYLSAEHTSLRIKTKGCWFEIRVRRHVASVS
jgi:hypothetical protein